MIRKSPQYDTTTPPGQIVNLEMPLGRAIEAFKAEEMEGLVRRVQQLENELKYERGLRLRLLATNYELENRLKNFSNF
jgi:hypothetical protein